METNQMGTKLFKKFEKHSLKFGNDKRKQLQTTHLFLKTLETAEIGNINVRINIMNNNFRNKN